ncbi:MAG: DUF302 domain-containing protein [Chromatiaceae bacterium]|nr:DUF302 domain-containing protein [Chromatiaceae bacterium]MCP5409079.1 DUF302 domain-containing protein [Chromatiaceae bacterium]MCP5441971.1 DUF302 domain-containing protein [Chromatiaceae bacterium]
MITNKLFLTGILLGVSLSANASGDLIKKASRNGVPQTMDRLEQIVRDKGLSVFNRIDHQANAINVEMEMGAAQVLIFGSPKLGTAIMKQDPAAGLDLPLRVLVYQDGEGKTWISYHDPGALESEYQLKGNPAILKAQGALGAITDAAAE